MLDSTAHGFRNILICLIGAISTCNQHAYAFNSDEHRAISDLAMEVAWGIAESRASTEDQKKEINDAMSALSGNYGQITECVDFFLIPEKMLDIPWSSRTPEFSSADGMPSLGKYSIHQLIERCGADNSWSAHFMQASHNNHAHFQQDLLMALRTWHMLAVSVGQPSPGRQRNIFGGLVINAISDHYLQDFFAPGHLVTPRDAMTDVQATAMHDLANKMGAVFLPGKISPELRKILEILCIPGGVEDECAPIPKVNATTLQKAHLTRRASPLQEILDRSKEADWALKFKGDGQLFSDDQILQRLYLVATQVRTILDVIDGQNNFQNFSFNFDRKSGRPYATTDFGRYDFEQAGRKIAAFSSESARPADAGIQWPKLPICSFGQCGDRLYQLRSSAPVFSISDQRESQSSGSYPGRSLYLVEVSWAGTLIDLNDLYGRLFSAVQVTPSFGFGYYEQFHEHGSGPSLRLSFAIPETEMSIAPYIRRMSYTDRGVTVRRNGYGLQFESGFSSYFTFFLLWGMDQSTDSQGSLQRGRIWGGGLRVSSPLTRLNPFN